MAFSKEYRCVIINPNDAPTMPCGVGTDKVGFIDIIAFGTDKQACLYDNQAKPSLCLHKRASADCSAVARLKTSRVHSTKRNACTAKEYNTGYSADQLAVLNEG